MASKGVAFGLPPRLTFIFDVFSFLSEKRFSTLLLQASACHPLEFVIERLCKRIGCCSSFQSFPTRNVGLFYAYPIVRLFCIFVPNKNSA